MGDWLHLPHHRAPLTSSPQLFTEQMLLCQSEVHLDIERKASFVEFTVVNARRIAVEAAQIDVSDSYGYPDQLLVSDAQGKAYIGFTESFGRRIKAEVYERDVFSKAERVRIPAAGATGRVEIVLPDSLEEGEQ